MTAHSWGDRVRTVARGIGELFVTVSVVLLLFVVYELWVTDLINQYKQRELTNALTAQWERGDDPIAPHSGDQFPKVDIGAGIALIRMPRLGDDYVRVIVEGTTREALDDGPGHYVSSALPGEVGNFAVAGHRGGKGSPFDDVDRLKAGDAIIIETRDSYFVYRVLGDVDSGDPTVPGVDGLVGRQIVDASQTTVVNPVPGEPGVAPHRRLLTLTTCQERYLSLERMIIHAELDGQAWPKSDGLPPAMRDA
ncbi:class E sortase [Antrihabitans sp. YC2-6]|uniref:class E sortase n=1 Tax=Antrihabitans sp. YC2-6 TaxID=2799498 RepID=UPI0018F2AE66|nr:class E sortase [Antrihabitans sp. YC2-6]MBJ8346149.1 class E sortase [Antrihabitans sp. YC2-6]